MVTISAIIVSEYTLIWCEISLVEDGLNSVKVLISRRRRQSDVLEEGQSNEMMDES